jgi:hypothetical protein
MRARSKLKPGQPGTRKLVEQCGDRLLCVRYRYDALKRRRYTTAEIIVDESDWDPMPSDTARRERVAVRIEVHEVKLREKVKAAGGRWDPEKRVWHLPMEQVLQLGLEGRVSRVEPSAPPDRSRAQPQGGV